MPAADTLDPPVAPSPTPTLDAGGPGGPRAWLGLTKFRLNSLVLFAVGGGFVLGSSGDIDMVRCALTILGAALVAMGGSALNMVMERDLDARMHRTRARPLVTGAVSVRAALAFGIALTLGGVAVLAFGVNVRAAATAAVIAVIYLAIYTPMKTRTSLNTIVGAVPGALPPVVGWVGAGGAFDIGAATLFAIIFFWQIPHFLAIARLHRDDYARGGFRMLPVLDEEGAAFARQAVLYAAALLAVTLVPAVIRLAGAMYFVAALGLGITFLAFALALAVHRTERAARRLFVASLVYLPALWTVLIIDHLPGA